MSSLGILGGAFVFSIVAFVVIFMVTTRRYRNNVLNALNGSPLTNVREFAVVLQMYRVRPDPDCPYTFEQDRVHSKVFLWVKKQDVTLFHMYWVPSYDTARHHYIVSPPDSSVDPTQIELMKRWIIERCRKHYHVPARA